MTERKERRRYPRIKDKDISIQLMGEGFDVITQSLDVSANGIYCKIKKPIPLMTRLQIVLALPNKSKSARPTILTIEGIVVREHPVKREGHIEHYDVAIFFNSLMPQERETLVNYISKKQQEPGKV